MISSATPPTTPGQTAGFDEHPLRRRLDAEFHARPPLPLDEPTRITHLAFLHEGVDGLAELLHFERRMTDEGWQQLASSAAYRLYERERVLVRCELHTEFSSYTLFVPTAGEAGKQADPLQMLPSGWRDADAGKLLVATRIELQSAAKMTPERKIAELATPEQQMVASRAVDGKAWIFTDFQLEDGASKFLMLDNGLTPRQAGRTVQRLWEIETYRVMALLGLPVAQAIGLRLRGAEEELANLSDRIGGTLPADDEYAVLADMTRLAAEVEHSVARTAFRFGASRAYRAIVMQRIDELREQRVEGFPTLREIMDRRLMPPMNTCAAMAHRQDDLSGRVARNSQLLRTRIDLALKRQNQLVLTQMNQRARQQLRLQETVEGLSVVAITYYGSQLAHHLAAGVREFWPAISPELWTGAAVPIIALAVALMLRRMRHRIVAEAAVE
jgi:uncharacterized membrane-anchored protein